MSFDGICLEVIHSGEDIFCHAHKSSQRHRLLNALAIDVAVVEWLEARELNQVHYYDVEQRRRRVAETEDFLRRGILKTWGTRDRYNLALECWEEMKWWYQESLWASVQEAKATT